MKRLVLMACVSFTIQSLTLVAPSQAKIDPKEIIAVWLFDEGSGKTIKDSEGQGINGAVMGDAKWANGIRGKALEFDGKKDYVAIPDSPHINSGGPYTNRTIMALFKCDDVSVKERKQTIFEEGGRTRGLVIYVHEAKLYAGGWNRAEYNWKGEWLSSPVKSNEWYYVALVLRNAKAAVEPDRFEMWLNGKLIKKAPGGQLHAHGDDIGIGMVNQNAVFHDDDGSGTNIHHFKGLIDEVRLYNTALDEKNMKDILGAFMAVEAADKLTATWGKIKAESGVKD